MRSSARIFHYFGTRRAYKSNFNPLTSCFSQRISRIVIKKDHYSPKGTFLHDQNLNSNLIECTKSGGWLSNSRFNRLKIWYPKSFKYFSSDRHPFGGLTSGFRAINLNVWRSIYLLPNFRRRNGLNFNVFYIQRKFNGLNSQEVSRVRALLCLDLGGAESFQHFISDVLPLLLPFRNFLQRNTDIIIGLPESSRGDVHRLLLDWVGIQNEIVFLGSNPYFVNELFTITADPKNYVYAVPSSLIYELASQLRLNKSPQNKIALLYRNQRTRNIANFDEIKSWLKIFCRNIGYELLIIDTNKLDITVVRNLLSECKILLSPHGGACYNVLFLRKDSLFVEFIPTKNTNTVEYFARSSGINYLPIPIDFDFYDRSFVIQPSLMINLGIAMKDFLDEQESHLT